MQPATPPTLLTLPADLLCLGNGGFSLKALYIKARKLWRNTNTAFAPGATEFAQT
jgi:hypothetical protein